MRRVEVEGGTHDRGRYDLAFLAVLLVYVLPFVLPMLRAQFTGDDLMNLYYHRYGQPPWRAFSDSLAFWTTYRRPLGGCVYLTLYALFGLSTPVPYYLTALLLFTTNLVLLFFLLLRLTRDGYVSVLAAAIASIHWEISDVWYNFGAVYELLSFGLILTSFHLYWSAIDARAGRARNSRYVAALVAYVLAIDGKEMAVTLPAVLLAFELIYRTPFDRASALLPRTALRLAPFAIIATIAVAGKTLGAEAVWRSNPAYAYHLDWTIVQNLGVYLEKICFNRVHIPEAAVLPLVAGGLGLALLLRDRNMLFGWCYFLITLLPVLGLPRVWGLFLYIPFAGLGLYLASGAVRLCHALWTAIEWLAPGLPRATGPAWVGLALALTGLAALHRPSMSVSAEAFERPGAHQAAFMQQLVRTYPVLPHDSVLLFLRSPYDSWALHFSVWLSYADPGISVIGGPNFSVQRFEELVGAGRTPHVFDYENDELREVSLQELADIDGRGDRL